MGLIARQVEAAGIPTLSMTSALSITRAVHPPRAAFVDFPLGHTTGKAHEPELQRAILADALDAFAKLEEPGSIVELEYRWSNDDAWKDRVMRADSDSGESGNDSRVERVATPQYQCEADRELAEAAGTCPTCVFVEE